MPFDRTAVRGVAEAQAAFRSAAPILQDRLADATEQTVRVIAFVAEQRVRRRFGILAAHIHWSMSRKTGVGRVGIGPRETVPLPHGAGSRSAAHGGRAVTVLGTEQPTHIAHLVEFGHGGPHPAQAYQFMIPAAEGEKGNYLQRCQAAGREAESQIAATGGGLL